MFCSNCGNKLNKESTFCPNCGTKVERKDEEKKTINNESSEAVSAPVTNTNNSSSQSSPELTKKVNNLCIISLICYFGVPLILSAFYTASESTNSVILGAITSFLSLFSFGSYIAAIVLMIVARVKDPKNTFAKVLMIVYIVLFVIELLALLFFIAACGALVSDCGRLY